MKVLHASIFIEWSPFSAYLALDPLFGIKQPSDPSFYIYKSKFGNMHKPNPLI